MKLWHEVSALIFWVAAYTVMSACLASDKEGSCDKFDQKIIFEISLQLSLKLVFGGSFFVSVYSVHPNKENVFEVVTHQRVFYIQVRLVVPLAQCAFCYPLTSSIDHYVCHWIDSANLWSTVFEFSDLAEFAFSNLAGPVAGARFGKKSLLISFLQSKSL